MHSEAFDRRPTADGMPGLASSLPLPRVMAARTCNERGRGPTKSFSDMGWKDIRGWALLPYSQWCGRSIGRRQAWVSLKYRRPTSCTPIKSWIASQSINHPTRRPQAGHAENRVSHKMKVFCNRNCFACPSLTVPPALRKHRQIYSQVSRLRPAQRH